MSKNIRIALDIMGGDQAPEMVIEGTAEAQLRYPDAQFILFGPKDKIDEELKKFPALASQVKIEHTDEYVESSDRPSHALRHGRNSSMGLALAAVRDGEADVAVSAGNTGALMALSKFTLRMLPGIDRPALISTLPTLRGESCLLDLGANIDCDSNNLVQFAVMGASYMRAVLGQNNPTIGLLNVGVEELKGSDTLRVAARTLTDSHHLHMDFTGFVEADSIGRGDVDVYVTDGFTGNMALKSIEGTAKLMSELMKRAYSSSLLAKLGYALSVKGLNSLRNHMDPNNHNGGVFIGLNGLVVKSHGGANAHGFTSAIGVAYDMTNNNLNQLIAEDLATITDTSS